MASRRFLSENRQFPSPASALPPLTASDFGLRVLSPRAPAGAIATSPVARFFETLAFLRLRSLTSSGQTQDRPFGVFSRKAQKTDFALALGRQAISYRKSGKF